MPHFGNRSRGHLDSCHSDIQKVFNEVIKHIDCSVTEGYRDALAQNRYYDEGKRKVKHPHGRHNKIPSLAADVTPYPVDYADLERQTLFAGFVLGVAKMMGIDMIWGNDWDGDFQTKDTQLKDYPHFELVHKIGKEE